MSELVAIQEHHVSVEWDKDPAAPKNWIWRLVCSCKYRRHWVSQKAGSVMESKAEVHAMDRHIEKERTP